MVATSARTRAALLALLVAFLWSTSWVLIRWGLDDEDRLPPVTFAGLRYGLAAVLVVTYTLAKGHGPAIRALDRVRLKNYLVLGVVMYGVAQGAQFVAIDNQPQATTSLVLAATPLIVAASSALFLGEPTTRTQRAGAVLIVGGAVVYFSGQLGATTVGMTAALVALAANAAGTMFGRSVNRASAGHGMGPSLVTTSVSMSVGAVGLLVTGLVVDGVPSISVRTALIITWLAVVNTAAGYTMWNHAQRRLHATEASAIISTMTVQIPVLAWIFLGERLGLAEVGGIALVVGGVLAITVRVRPGRSRRSATPPVGLATVDASPDASPTLGVPNVTETIGIARESDPA